MICPHCSRSFAAGAVTHQRGKGFNAQIQCPHCEAWLAKSPTLLKLKLIGFYVAVAAITYCYFVPTSKVWAIPAAIFAGITVFVSHMMDQLRVVEAPERPDDSEQRQKYR